MGNKQPKIVSIATSVDNHMLFTLGLGKDNRCYLWNSALCQWMLHKSVPQPDPPATLSRQQRRQLERPQEKSHVAE